MRALFSIILVAGALLLVAPLPAFADAQTGECTSGEYGSDSVGPFMQNICQECYDQGNCSLRDVETVFANISQFILGIIASLVFLMYIIGGMYWIGSEGRSERISKGKKYIVGSTVGLFFVLIAYALVVSLKSALQTGEIQNYVVCDGTTETTSQACAPNSECSETGVCIPSCVAAGGQCVPASLVGTGEFTSCTSGGTAGCVSADDECCLVTSP